MTNWKTMANDNFSNQQMPYGQGRPNANQSAAGRMPGQQPQQPQQAQQPGTVNMPAGMQGQQRTPMQNGSQHSSQGTRPTAVQRSQGRGIRSMTGAGMTAHRSTAGQTVGAEAEIHKKRTPLIIAGVIVAAFAIWLLIFLFACNGNSLIDPAAQNGQAPYKSAAEMQAELDRVVEEGMFNISIASVIQFDDGTSTGTAYIENVPGNHYNMQVTITEDDTGDLLYESGILKPDQYIEDIVLSKDLDAGTYAATATFTALDEASYDEVGQAAAKVTISVLS